VLAADLGQQRHMNSVHFVSWLPQRGRREPGPLSGSANWQSFLFRRDIQPADCLGEAGERAGKQVQNGYDHRPLRARSPHPYNPWPATLVRSAI